MSVVDSSGWIEFLGGTESGREFVPALRDARLVVPTIVIVEVRRWLLTQRREADLERVTGLMMRGQLVVLDMELASLASTLGIRHRLPLADSIVYATAQSLDLEVWTQDRDFEGLAGVRYIPKAGG